MPANSQRLAFIELWTPDREQFRAALLVTNEWTEPVEFRCTSVVRPNRVQKLLWGARLTNHLITQVLGKPLLASLAEPVGLVLVRQRVLLELRTSLECPVVQVLPKDEDETARALSAKTAEPVFLRTHPLYPTDFASAQATLAPGANQVSWLEPFNRCVQALSLAPVDATHG